MKFATVGTGVISENLIKAMQANDIEVIASCGRNLDKVKEFTKKMNVALSYDNYDEMMDNPDIDFVYIGVPNGLHYDYAKKALLKGKNLLVEKAFTSHYEEAIELVELAKEKGLYIYCGCMPLYSDYLKSIKEHLNELGRIRYVQMNFSKYSKKYDAFKAKEEPTLFSTKYSSGALMDIGVYNMSVIHYLFGEPESVKYTCNITDGIDTSGVAELIYDDFFASAVNGKDDFGLNFFNVSGELGFISFIGAPMATGKYELKMNGKDPVTYEFKEHAYTKQLFEIKRMYENKCLDECYDLIDVTLGVMRTLDKLRADAGIVFEADAKRKNA